MGDAKNEMNTSELFIADIANEEKFLKTLGKDHVEGLETELQAMFDAYKEQLDKYIRIRFDADIFRTLERMEPNIQAHTENKVANNKAHREVRVIIKVIREQILTLLNKN